MRLFDPFVHASERTAEDHERMSLEGLTAVLEPVRRRGGPWSHPSSFIDHVRDLVDHEPRRLEVFGPRHLQALAIPTGGVTDLEMAMACIEQLRPWLERPTVVAALCDPVVAFRPRAAKWSIRPSQGNRPKTAEIGVWL